MFEEFLPQLLLWVGILAVTVSTVLLFLFYRVGFSIDRFKTHWSTDGKGAKNGIIMALVVPTLVAIILFLVTVAPAKAEELRWFDSTTVFVGIDRTFFSSPQCESNNVDQYLTSNMGLTQNIFRKDSISVNAKYTHHSCALGVDDAPYDAIGISAEWTFPRAW